MILTITNQCNRRCEFCFEGAFRDAPPAMMSLADVEDLCEFFEIPARRSDAYATILGGEPTLHPELLQIIDLLRSHHPALRILLLTNLLCDSDLLYELHGRRMSLLVNLVSPEQNSPVHNDLLETNLALLNGLDGLLVTYAVTITTPDQDFDFLYERLRNADRSSVCGVRIGFSAPGNGFANRFVNEFTPAYGEKYLEIIRTCHQINPRLRFSNECTVNMCLMRENIYTRLKPMVSYLDIQCTEPNMDILPDMSTHWCFAFRGVPEMRIDNIFEYSSPEAVLAALRERLARLLRTYPPQCEHANCGEILCTGPCPALNYYRAVVQKT